MPSSHSATRTPTSRSGRRITASSTTARCNTASTSGSDSARNGPSSSVRRLLRLRRHRDTVPGQYVCAQVSRPISNNDQTVYRAALVRRFMLGIGAVLRQSGLLQRAHRDQHRPPGRGFRSGRTVARHRRLLAAPRSLERLARASRFDDNVSQIGIGFGWGMRVVVRRSGRIKRGAVDWCRRAAGIARELPTPRTSVAGRGCEDLATANDADAARAKPSTSRAARLPLCRHRRPCPIPRRRRSLARESNVPRSGAARLARADAPADRDVAVRAARERIAQPIVRVRGLELGVRVYAPAEHGSEACDRRAHDRRFTSSREARGLGSPGPGAEHRRPDRQRRPERRERRLRRVKERGGSVPFVVEILPERAVETQQDLPHRADGETVERAALRVERGLETHGARRRRLGDAARRAEA